MTKTTKAGDLERAVTLRDDLATRMTPADLSEAQRRAMEWHEAHPVPLYF